VSHQFIPYHPHYFFFLLARSQSNPSACPIAASSRTSPAREAERASRALGEERIMRTPPRRGECTSCALSPPRRGCAHAPPCLPVHCSRRAHHTAPQHTPALHHTPLTKPTMTLTQPPLLTFRTFAPQPPLLPNKGNPGRSFNHPSGTFPGATGPKSHLPALQHGT